MNEDLLCVRNLEPCPRGRANERSDTSLGAFLCFQLKLYSCLPLRGQLYVLMGTPRCARHVCLTPRRPSLFVSEHINICKLISQYNTSTESLGTMHSRTSAPFPPCQFGFPSHCSNIPRTLNSCPCGSNLYLASHKHRCKTAMQALVSRQLCGFLLLPDDGLWTSRSVSGGPCYR